MNLTRNKLYLNLLECLFIFSFIPKIYLHFIHMSLVVNNASIISQDKYLFFLIKIQSMLFKAIGIVNSVKAVCVSNMYRFYDFYLFFLIFFCYHQPIVYNVQTNHKYYINHYRNIICLSKNILVFVY